MANLNYLYRTWDTSRTLWVDGNFNGELSHIEDVIAPTLSRLPADIQRVLRRDLYGSLARAKNWADKYAAQDKLAAEVAQFEAEALHIAFDNEEIQLRAERCAYACQRMQDFNLILEYCKQHGIGFEPRAMERSRIGCMNRARDVGWWRRKLRHRFGQRAENHLRKIGLVRRSQDIYISRLARAQKQAQARTLDRWIGERVVTSDDGIQLELAEVVERSLANCSIRRGELMKRMRGFEEIAQEEGHVSLFFTLTCPSAFHPALDEGGLNPRFDGVTGVKGAQEWLTNIWSRTRARLDRRSIFYYGIRVAEPHHDGTPHWHMVLFTRETDAEPLSTILREMWLSEYHDEPGARLHRVQVQPIDTAKGSATGYIAKYIAKNIDGHEVGEDLEAGEGKGVDAKNSAPWAVMWARFHRIRQFQQVGGPAIGVYRELRRIRKPVKHRAIECAREGAEHESFASFIKAQGGIVVGRKTAVTLWREQTGEISKYEEIRLPQTAGVQCGAFQLRTRDKTWRIQRKEGMSQREGLSVDGACTTEETGADRPAFQFSGSRPSLGPVTITVRSARIVPSERSGDIARVRTRAGHIRGSPWIN